MYNNNRYNSWGNNNHASQKPHYEEYMSPADARRENAKLDEYRKSLEKEIAELNLRKQALEARFSDPECEERFRNWGGCQILDSSETFFSINFVPHFRGKVSGIFAIGLKKSGPAWSLSHHNLPFSIRNITQRVNSSNITSISGLSAFIRCLQQEINLFVLRHEQFKEAKELVTPSFLVYPSVSTTNVMLNFNVSDSIGSDLRKAFVYLTYQSHKFLPEEPYFKFIGGDEIAQSAFKEQLTILECMPLKEAILSAFPNISTSIDSSACFLSEPAAQAPAEETANQKSIIPEATTPTTSARKKSQSSTGPVKLGPKLEKQPAPAENDNDESPPHGPPTPPAGSNDQKPSGKGRGRGTSASKGRGTTTGRGATTGRGSSASTGRGNSRARGTSRARRSRK